MTPRPLRFLISRGPTREPLDPVRFISNYSTGFMGHALAVEALARGRRVTLVSGPTELPPPRGARAISIERAEDLRQAMRREAPKADVIIMAAAVSDFQPARPARRKLARRGARRLELRATPDIIGTLPRRSGQLVVGFALESADAVARARRKLVSKRLDLIIGQTMPAPAGARGGPGNGHGSPFGRRPVEAFLLDAGGRVRRPGRIPKPMLARLILDEIDRLWYGGLHANREGCPTC